MPFQRRLAGSLSSIALVVGLFGCGGGGGGGGSDTGGGNGGSGGGSGGGGTVVSPLSFPARSGYTNRLVNGADDRFTISGTCSGTAQITAGAVAATTFEGVAGYQGSQTSTVNFSNCIPATSTASGTTFYDSAYATIGTIVTGLEYSKFAAAPVALPSSVRVGDSGPIVSLTTYTDSTKATATGRRDLSYVVEADTSNTAILNIVTKTYDTTNALLLTQQNRYRMGTDGSLAPVSIDVDYGAPSNAHLVYTKS